MAADAQRAGINSHWQQLFDRLGVSSFLLQALEREHEAQGPLLRVFWRRARFAFTAIHIKAARIIMPTIVY